MQGLVVLETHVYQAHLFCVTHGERATCDGLLCTLVMPDVTMRRPCAQALNLCHCQPQKLHSGTNLAFCTACYTWADSLHMSTHIHTRARTQSLGFGLMQKF